MKLSIILIADTLDEAKTLAEEHLSSKLRIEQEQMSMFEQYRLYPGERKFIPKMWTYRIVCNKGQYHFGILESPSDL